MRSLTEATLYPGIGLLETTNVSVGRGTDTPCEVIGAPWIDAQKLSSALNERIQKRDTRTLVATLADVLVLLTYGALARP